MSYLDTNFADWSHQQPRHLLHFYKNGSTSDIDQLIDGFAVIGTTTAYLFAVLYVGLSIYASKREVGRIAHEAHLGGALGGLALTLLLYPAALSIFLSQLGLG